MADAVFVKSSLICIILVHAPHKSKDADICNLYPVTFISDVCYHTEVGSTTDSVTCDITSKPKQVECADRQAENVTT